MIVSPLEALFDDPLVLESGKRLDSYVIGYEMYGALNAEADNAILVCHGLTHSCHAAGVHKEDDLRPGWWDAMIGPGKLLDTDQYCVICANCLGSCFGSSGPSSIDPDTGKPYGLHFPVVTIGDSVRAHKRLAERLGIAKFKSVIGGCMGGFVALDWMVRYPEMVGSAVVISATEQASAHTLALWEVMRQTIMADPEFKDGDYYDGPGPCKHMGLTSMFGMMIWMSRDIMAEKYGRKLIAGERKFTLEPEYEVQGLFKKILDNAGGGIDPNALIYLTRTMDYFDLPAQGDLKTQFGPVTCPTLLVSYDTDWRYPPEEMDAMGKVMREAGVPVEHVTLSSPYGHGAFHCDAQGMATELIRFLSAL